MLYIAFTAAQLHGSRIFYVMWKRQERLIKEQDDLEKAAGLPKEESVDVEEEGRHEVSGGGNA